VSPGRVNLLGRVEGQPVKSQGLLALSVSGRNTGAQDKHQDCQAFHSEYSHFDEVVLVLDDEVSAARHIKFP
jgi:hypothetical protein